MKKSLRRWFWLGGSAIVLGLIAYNLTRSPELRTFDWDRLWRSLMRVQPGFLLAAMAVTLLSHLVRAYRWKFFLDPIKKNSSLWILYAGQILGFSSIYLIGRLGEFVRPAYIAKKEDVTISAMLAVWLLERIYDTVFTVLLFVLAIQFAPLHLTGPHAMKILVGLHRASRILMVIMALVIAGLVFLRLRAERLAAFLARALGFLPPRIRRSLRNVFYSFTEGLGVIRDWKDLTASLLSSALLWFVNVSMVWLVLRSLDGPLDRLNWMAAATVLFCSALGLVVQLPGLGGGYQVAAIGALRLLFGVNGEAATGAAILLWIAMSVPCLTLGLFVLLYEGLSFRKLGAIAREELAAMAQQRSGVGS